MRRPSSKAPSSAMGIITKATTPNSHFLVADSAAVACFISAVASFFEIGGLSFDLFRLGFKVAKNSESWKHVPLASGLRSRSDQNASLGKVIMIRSFPRQIYPFGQCLPPKDLVTRAGIQPRPIRSRKGDAYAGLVTRLGDHAAQSPGGVEHLNPHMASDERPG